MSGYHLRDEFAQHDAEKLFDVAEIATLEPEICISGEILRGIKKPHDCPAFGTLCTPQRPLGATMVSAEGACAAYYAYGRHLNLSSQQIVPTRRCGMTHAHGELRDIRKGRGKAERRRPVLVLALYLSSSMRRSCWGMAAVASLRPI